MTPSPRLLYVAWQDPQTRRILPVARLVMNEEGGYELAYIHAVAEAQEYGFLPLLSFPDLQQVYRSRELLPFLHNRLLQSSRPDYEDYLGQLGLTGEAAEPFAVLERSGGRRATDKLELFSPPTFVADGVLGCVVLARGVQHVRGAEAKIASLQAGSRLEAVVEPTNPINPRALKLRTGGEYLGYLPDYLVSELACDPEQVEVIVKKVNLPPAPVHHRLLLEVSFPATEPRPFSGHKYLPLSADASALAA